MGNDHANTAAKNVVLSKSRQPEVRDSWVLWFRPMCITRIWRYRRARRRPNRPIAQRRR